jgi:very-short-patch-repair endonuclease
VTPTQALHELGGVASWTTLRRRVGRAELAAAVSVGDVVIDARGRYALPGADIAIRAAARVGGVASHRSAAQLWGWAQKELPEVPEVTVPKDRRIPTRGRVRLHWADLAPDEIDDRRTTPERTLADCLRTLPFDEALAIADSALRSGDVGEQQLGRLAGRARGPGSRGMRRVADRASALAANPFESVLRALALEVGLDVRPQVPLFGDTFLGRPDLVDERRRLVLEADSFTWHGNRRALHRDVRRYNAFVLQGWTVLRFAWEDVHHDQDHVTQVLRQATQLRTDRRQPTPRHA